ncbi:hypothetical protein JCM11641_003177 [Rhodosporidiobolus odoratus]
MAAAPLVLGLWSVVLEPGKTLTQTTTPAIQITNISYGAEVKGNARSAVLLSYPEFEQGDEDEEDESEEEADADDDSPIKLPKLITKETCLAVLKPNGTEQVSINVNLVEDVEVVEFSVTGENSVHLVGHYIRQEDFDQEPYSDEEEYDSEDDSEFDDEEMSGLIAGSDDESMEDGADRIQELLEEKPKASKKRAAIEDASTADDSIVSAADLAGLSKNQKKKLAKKQKGETGEAVAPAAVAETKKADAPTPQKEEKKAEAPKKAAGSKTQVLAGGLEVTDAKEGTGPAAKSGSKVGMRYIGKLDNGKVFDSNTKGAPLNFNLGRGQVIKGWDLGVAGMKVGGERKLRIPAALAYGKQKLPGIPANSVLNFDVKASLPPPLSPRYSALTSITPAARFAQVKQILLEHQRTPSTELSGSSSHRSGLNALRTKDGEWTPPTWYSAEPPSVDVPLGLHLFSNLTAIHLSRVRLDNSLLPLLAGPGTSCRHRLKSLIASDCVPAPEVPTVPIAFLLDILPFVERCRPNIYKLGFDYAELMYEAVTQDDGSCEQGALVEEDLRQSVVDACVVVS